MSEHSAQRRGLALGSSEGALGGGESILHNLGAGGWLTKRKHYDGGESVTGVWDSETLAQADVDEMNGQYQTDAYYVEEYDPAKLDWPCLGAAPTDITPPKEI